MSAWQEFDVEREDIWQFMCLVSPVLQRELIFSSLDNLKIEMKNVKVRAQTENVIVCLMNCGLRIILISVLHICCYLLGAS